MYKTSSLSEYAEYMDDLYFLCVTKKDKLELLFEVCSNITIEEQKILVTANCGLGNPNKLIQDIGIIHGSIALVK